MLKLTYEASLDKLARAAQGMVYDNTTIDVSHPVVLDAHSGDVRFLTEDVPAWLMRALCLA